MANPTGMDAAETLTATRHSCNNCKRTNVNFSQCILVNVIGDNRITFCKQCYVETVKDDPDDCRASRGTAADGGDTELSGMQWRRDKSDSEHRPYTTLKHQHRTALGQVCQTLVGVVNAEKLREVRMTIAKGLDKRAMEVYISKVEKIVAKEEPT